MPAPAHRTRPRVVVVGGGFAGYHAARSLLRRTRGEVEVVLVNPTDYFLYLPLLPEVATGLAATAVTRGYHLLSMPGNRVRVAADWLLDATVGRQTVQLGLVRSPAVPLDTSSPGTPAAAASGGRG